MNEYLAFALQILAPRKVLGGTKNLSANTDVLGLPKCEMRKIRKT